MNEDMNQFKSDVEILINRYSIDAKAGTPDYILAEMVATYLGAEIFRHCENERRKRTNKQEALIS